MTKQQQNTRIIIDAMCDNGFMNGWFGDVSERFRAEKVEELMALSTEQKRIWVELNKFNLTVYCQLNPIPQI